MGHLGDASRPAGERPRARAVHEAWIAGVQARLSQQRAAHALIVEQLAASRECLARSRAKRESSLSLLHEAERILGRGDQPSYG